MVSQESYYANFLALVTQQYVTVLRWDGTLEKNTTSLNHYFLS